MNAALMLLLVVTPAVLALASDQGPLVWYVLDAALCGAVLFLYSIGKPWRLRAVCWLGVGIHACAAWYGLANESGVTPTAALWWLLVGFVVVAEVVGGAWTRGKG